MCNEAQEVIHIAAATLKTEFGDNGRKKRNYWNNYDCRTSRDRQRFFGIKFGCHVAAQGKGLCMIVTTLQKKKKIS